MQRSLAILMLMVCAASGQYWGTGVFLPSNSGVRGMAMGGCYVALVDNHESLIKNPAGLAFLKQTEAGLSGRGVMLGEVRDDLLREFGISTKYLPHFALREVFFATNVPLQVNLTLGAGLGWSTFYDDGYAIRQSAFGGYYDFDTDVVQNGGLSVVTPAIGAAYDGRYAVGVAVGRALFSPWSRSVEVDDPMTGRRREEWQARMNGSVAVFGLQARPVDRLFLGFSYMPGLEFEMEDREYEPPVGPIESWPDIGYEVPDQITIGAAYCFEDIGVVVAGEYGNRPFRRTRTREGREDWTRLEVDDGHSMRVGVEFRTAVDLRFGYAADHIGVAVRSDRRRPTTLHTVSVGAGVPAGSISIDLGAEYAFVEWKREFVNEFYSRSENTLRIAASLTIGWAMFVGQ